MQKRKLNNQGFGVVAILIAVLVVLVIGGASYLVWHKNHESKKSTTQNSKTDSASSNKSTGTKVAADPYEGWKTYTDSANHYSFKYPADWTLTDSTSDSNASASLVSPDGDVYIDYTNPLVKDGDNMDFYVSSISDISTLSSVKVLGGMFTDQNSPRYYVVDSSQTADLTVGSVGQVVNTARFAEGNGNDAQLVAHYAGAPYGSTEAAKAWFGTEDAKTTLLILKSLAQ